MAELSLIEGIGDVYAEKLKAAGILTLEALLQEGAKRLGRKALAEKTGINEKLLLEWLNRADFFRIKGIGEEYSDLLESAGVDTVPELAQRNAEGLYQKLVAINEAKHAVRRLPSQAQVANWIEQAKQLPRVIEY